MKERKKITVREEELRARFAEARSTKDYKVLKPIYEELFELTFDYLVNRNAIVSWRKSEPNSLDRQQGQDYWLADTAGVVPFAVVDRRHGKKYFMEKYPGVMVIWPRTRQGNLREVVSMAESIERLMGERS